MIKYENYKNNENVNWLKELEQRNIVRNLLTEEKH